MSGFSSIAEAWSRLFRQKGGDGPYLLPPLWGGTAVLPPAISASRAKQLRRDIARGRAKLEDIAEAIARKSDEREHLDAIIDAMSAEAHAVADAIAINENELETGERLGEPRPVSFWVGRGDWPLKGGPNG